MDASVINAADAAFSRRTTILQGNSLPGIRNSRPCGAPTESAFNCPVQQVHRSWNSSN